MKKILFVFLILVSFLFINNESVFASSSDNINKPLICMVGQNHSNLLEYEGYEIISGKVDFYNVGTYYITYLNTLTKSTVTKRVDVISDNEFSNDIYYRYNVDKYISTSSDVIDALEYKDYTYVLERCIDKNDIILTKLDKNKIIFSKAIRTDIDITLRNLVIDDTGIYILGNVYVEGYGIDIYLGCYDFEGKLILENTFGGIGIDNAYDMVINGDYLFVYGDTTSSNGIFSGIRKNEDSFILKINKDLLFLEDSYVSTLAYNNTIKFGVIADDTLYMLEQYVDVDKVSYFIKVFNQDLKIISNKPFINGYSISFNQMKVEEERIFLIGYQYNYMIEKYASRIYEIDLEGNSSLFFEHTNYSIDNKRIIDINLNNTYYEILLTDLTTLENEIIIKDKTNNIDLVVKCKSGQPLHFLEGNTYISKDKEIVKYICILDSSDVFINGTLIKESSSSIIHKEVKTFGKYRNVYIYETNEVTYVKHKDIYVEPNLSFFNNGIFDIGLTLNFNGTGYLNDELVISGFTINNSGKYTFLLVGENDERRTYQFEVRDISSKDFETKNDNKLLNISINKKQNDTSNNITLFNSHDINQETKTYMYWLLLIPAILLVLGIILIMVKKHGKKNNSR